MNSSWTSTIRRGAAALALGLALLAGPGAREASAQGAFYVEETKEGRIYVFNDMKVYATWKQSGEVGPAITRPGRGPAGETLVFDSEEAIHLYNFRHNLPGEVFEKKDTKPTTSPFKVKTGGTIFADYTYTDEPTSKDADGKTINASAFNVTRAYLNVTGNLTDDISFRITPDISREAGTGSSLSGSYTFRLKYAFGQYSLEQLLGHGAFVRFGLQQTPYIDFHEGLYRYRFQGPTFFDKEGYITSSDLGIAVKGNIASIGDYHVGYYNGDGYSKPEANDQKALMGRLTFKPFEGDFAGFRFTVFYDHDFYEADARRERLLGEVTWESRWVNAGATWGDLKDQAGRTKPEIEGQGYSLWVTPKTDFGLEGLLRYDDLEPNKDADARKKRLVVGVAYWFPQVEKGPATALMLDYENVKYDDYAPAKPEEKRWALHFLLSF